MTGFWNYFDSWRSKRVRARSRHRRALLQLPAGLYQHWRAKAHLEFKSIPSSELFFMRAAEGLMDFFECASGGRQPCALPSNAADSVWHAWIWFAPATLDQFCKSNFGKTIAHVDAAALDGGKDAALANCLVRARKAESIPAAGPQLPRLFKLDSQLRMPGGFGYRNSDGQVGWRRLNQSGKPDGALFFVDALAPSALLGAALLTPAEHLDYQRRLHDSSTVNDGGSSTGTSYSGSNTSSDRADCDSNSKGSDSNDSSGCSDSSSDGGSSCGNSCGGGD